MELHNRIVIAASALAVWEAIGERFVHIGQWAAPIVSSCPINDAPLAVGMVRACRIARFGPFSPGVIRERLTTFDREAMSLSYEAQDGMPRFVANAVNRWSVHRVDASQCEVRVHATLTLRGPMKLFGWLLRNQLEASGVRVLEELKYYVEQGAPHPRKRAASRHAPGV